MNPEAERSATPFAPPRLPGLLWVVMALLVVSVFINYIDRGNLAIAAPMIKDELKISESKLGFLLSAFFWSYPLFQAFSGWLVDRFNVNWVMAAGFFLWSAATGVTGLVHGFEALMIVRLVLGVGESVAYPAYSRILATYFPDSHRGVANALIGSGLACGPAFGMLAGGMLMSRLGWRPFFVVLGFASLIWLIPWIIWMPRGPGIPKAKHESVSPKMYEILLQRSAWGTFFGLFCANYILYLLITWLPYFLTRDRHFSMDAMAKIGGAVFLAAAISSALTGRLSDRWILAGASPTKVRKSCLVLGNLGGGMFLFASSLGSPAFSAAMLVLAGTFFGSSICTIWPVTQTLAGPYASGRWTGLQCLIGNYAGVLTSTVTGFLVQRTGHFVWPFAVAMMFGWMSALCWIFWVGPIEPVVWKGPTGRVVAQLA